MVKDLKIQENKSIYDIANETLGGFDNIYAGILQLNPAITSIDFDLNTIASDSIYYDDSYYSTPTIQIQLDVKNPSPIVTITGLENQSIYDIVLMTYGDLGSVYDFIKSNGIVSLNDLSVAMKTFTFDLNNMVNGSLYASVKKSGYIFSTLTQGDSDFLLQENGYFILQENGYKIKLNA